MALSIEIRGSFFTLNVRTYHVEMVINKWKSVEFDKLIPDCDRRVLEAVGAIGTILVHILQGIGGIREIGRASCRERV